jgi:hypothetical protein
VTKANILESFDDALIQPAAAKSGNVLADELKLRAKQFASSDREGLVDAVGEWLASRDAVRVLKQSFSSASFILRSCNGPSKEVRAEVCPSGVVNLFWVQ